MKKLISLLIFCVIVGCISNNRYHIDEVTNPTDTLYYLKSDMSLLNGVVYNEFGDVGLFKNGKPNGLIKTWYKNGQLELERNYTDGELNGLLKVWYENGQLKSEVNYKDDKFDGLTKTWYENGQLEFERNYTDGELNGLLKWWKENGQLISKVNYDNGLIEKYY
jgi:antitoxin component YwqK of YwqJK toxin-antitoxin module